MRTLLILSCSILEIAASGALKAQAMPTPPPIQPVFDELGVDMRSGSLTLAAPSLVIGSGDQGMTYIKSISAGGAWIDNFTGFANVIFPESGLSSYTVTVDGKTWSTFSHFGSFVPNDGVTFSGVQGNTPTDHVTAVERDGSIALFTPLYTQQPGASYYTVSQITRPSGETISFYYADAIQGGVPQRRLQSVVSNRGFQLHIDYITNDTNNVQWLTPASAYLINNGYDYCDPTAIYCSALSNAWNSLTFSYPSQGMAVTDPYGNTTTFSVSFPPSGIQMSKRRPGSVTDDYTFNSVWAPTLYPGGDLETHVTSVVASGQTWTYSYSDSNGNRIVSRVDPNNNTKTFHSSAGSENLYHLNSITDEIGRTSTYITDCDTELVPSGMPEGNSASYSCSQRNTTQITYVPKPSSSLASKVLTFSYPASCVNPIICHKPISAVDALLHETDFTYDGVHGGLLTAMGPPPAAGAARPLKLTSWVQRYARVMNSSGTLVQAPTPVWVVASDTDCQTVAGSNATTCDSAAPKMVTTYEYGATGTAQALLVKGKAVSSGGVTLRTCYSYDRYGRKISETKPNANLGACS